MPDINGSISRRHFLGILALAGGATVLTACQAAVPGGGPTAANAVSFMDWSSLRPGDPLDKAIAEFRKANTQYNVKVEPTPGNYEAKMRTLLAAGTPPDIMRVNDDYVRGYSVKHQLLDLSKYMQRDKIKREDYFEFIFDFPRQADGQYTAWPIGNQPRLIYYNVDLFKQVGAPLPPTDWTDKAWKWGDFLALAQKLTLPDQRWGALVYDDTGFEQTFSINNGDETGIYSKDGTKFTLADPKGVEAVQWVTDLTCKHRVQPDWAYLQKQSANNLFVSGKIGMLFRTFGETPYLRKAMTHTEWDVAPVPGNIQQRTEGSLIVFCVPKITKNPDGAWKLLSFLGGPVAGKIFAEEGQFVPIRKESANLIRPSGSPPAHIELFIKAMAQQTTVNFTENTERARQIYRPELSKKAFTCQASAQEVLGNVRHIVEDSLVGKY